MAFLGNAKWAVPEEVDDGMSLSRAFAISDGKQTSRVAGGCKEIEKEGEDQQRHGLKYHRPKCGGK